MRLLIKWGGDTQATMVLAPTNFGLENLENVLIAVLDGRVAKPYRLAAVGPAQDAHISLLVNHLSTSEQFQLSGTVSGLSPTDSFTMKRASSAKSKKKQTKKANHSRLYTGC